MIFLANFLRPEDVKTINRKAFLNTATTGNYLESDLLATPPTGTLKQINNVRNADINEAIRAVAAFDKDTLRRAWSHHMALQCGLHFWPDANHRTAVLSFNLAPERSLGWHLSSRKGDVIQLIADRKAYRQLHGVDLKMDALTHPENEYCKFFQQYEPKLTIKAASGEGGLY